MPNITVAVDHSFSQDEALRRVRAYLAQAKAQFGDQVNNLQEDWNGYVGILSGSVQGHSVSATIDVNPMAVVVQLTVPFAALIYKSKIEATIRAQLGKALS